MFCQVCDKGQQGVGQADLGLQPSLSTLISKTDVSATQSWAPEGIQRGEPHKGLAWGGPSDACHLMKTQGV